MSVSTEALIAAINSDIEEAKEKLEQPEHLKLRGDNFFTSSPSSSSALPSSTASTSQTIMNGHWQLAVTASVCAWAHTNTHIFLCTHRFVYRYLLKCTASFWDFSAVAIAATAHQHNHKPPIIIVFFFTLLVLVFCRFSTDSHLIDYVCSLIFTLDCCMQLLLKHMPAVYLESFVKRDLK